MDETPRNDALAVMVCYNTAEWTKQAVAKFPPDRDYDVVLVDDGSSDNTGEYVKASGFAVIQHPANRGLGAAIRSGLDYACEHGYEAVALLAGNNKDDPREIPRLLAPLRAGECDFVQGSRFAQGGSYANLPQARHFLVKVHALMMRVLTGMRTTDAINGFRAYRTSILADPRIRLHQDWLDGYALETYLLYKVLKLDYRVAEVPVSKTYPAERGVKYSHVRPIVDWWHILKPLLLLSLRLRT